jgi:hypothetical protein
MALTLMLVCCGRPSATTDKSAASATAVASVPVGSSTVEPVPAPVISATTPSGEAFEALLAKFVAPGADLATLSKSLRPTHADFQALFDPQAATKLEAAYGPDWDRGSIVIAPKVGQSTFKVSSATVADLNTGANPASAFPRGYLRVAPHMVTGHTWYRVEFLKPGEAAGMAFDGFTFVNGHWVIVPKPWRAL